MKAADVLLFLSATLLMGIVTAIGVTVGGVTGCEVGIAAARSAEREEMIRRAATSRISPRYPPGDSLIGVGGTLGAVLGMGAGGTGGALIDVCRLESD